MTTNKKLSMGTVLVDTSPKVSKRTVPVDTKVSKRTVPVDTAAVDS